MSSGSLKGDSQRLELRAQILQNQAHLGGGTGLFVLRGDVMTEVSLLAGPCKVKRNIFHKMKIQSGLVHQEARRLPRGVAVHRPALVAGLGHSRQPAVPGWRSGPRREPHVRQRLPPHLCGLVEAHLQLPLPAPVHQVIQAVLRQPLLFSNYPPPILSQFQKNGTYVERLPLWKFWIKLEMSIFADGQMPADFFSSRKFR